jgi:DNA-directed RNA polymerase specialized sigma24 family protein
MIQKVEKHLATFNILAQHYQDEAYTLAYYLLGDEARASEALQAAFTRLYHRTDLQMEHFRFDVLRWVLAYCRNSGGIPMRAANSGEIARQLSYLEENERTALVLVDVLGLDYSEAARVLGCSSKQIGKLLAQGRVGFARRDEGQAMLAGAI